MHRQQVLKCHLSDRFVAGCGRFQKKTATLEHQYLCGFQRSVADVATFFKS